MKRQVLLFHLKALQMLFLVGLLLSLTSGLALPQPLILQNKLPAVLAKIDGKLLGDTGPSAIKGRQAAANPEEVVPIIIQMAGDPLGKVVFERGQMKMSVASQSSYARTLTLAQATVVDGIKGLGGIVTQRYHRAYNGLAARVKRGDLINLARQPGVVAIYRDGIVKRQLTVSVPFIGAEELNEQGVKGTGIRIGIIDTGIDYTHKDFGGPGSREAYDLEANDPTHLHPGTFPTAKVAGGTDLVGDRYDPVCSSSDKNAGKCTDVPEPDPNPIDLEGHGTGMAGIAAGVGVPGKVGHGVAPEAILYVIKVFALGDTADSNILAAIEWAMDPNGNGDLSDHLDVINLSLGSDSGPSFGPEADAIDAATRLGMVVAASAGNGDDFPYVAGSPANSPQAISIAASQKGGSKAPSVIVNTPSSLSTLFAVHQPWSQSLVGSPITGNLVYVGGEGCSTYPPGVNVSGMIALIDRGTCFIQEKVDVAQAAGAIAAIIAQNTPADPFDAAAGHAGTNTIPAVMIFQDDGSQFKDALQSGAVNVTLDMDTHATDMTDALSGYTARGPSVPTSVLKPDITAPANVFSAGVGTGDGSLFVNGTSAAAPHVAGSAALLKQLYPMWSPAEIKVALMNTAKDTRVVRAAGSAGTLAPMSRTGAGRVSVSTAANLHSLAFGDEDTGSLSFGFHALSRTYTATKAVTVVNYDTTPKTYTASWAFRDPNEDGNAGVKLTIKPTRLTVGPSKSGQFRVTLTANPKKIHDHELDAGLNGNRADLLTLEEYDGWIMITDGKSDTLRLPFHFFPRKASEVSTHPHAVALSQFGTAPSKTINVSNVSFYKGIVEVFSLLEDSNPKRVVAGRDPSADIRATGVRAYNIPGIGDIIEFAINCWNIHALLATLLSYDVFLDTDLDGIEDYDIFPARLTDGRVATVILNLKTNEMVISSLFDGDFNSNNVILTVVASDLGLSPSNLKFNFYFATFDSFGMDPVDVSPVDLLTVGRPFTYDGNSPRFRTDSLTYEVDHSATIRVYADNNGFQASPSDKGLLLLHRNNAPEAEAESINVMVTSTTILADRLDSGYVKSSTPSKNFFGSRHMYSGFDEKNTYHGVTQFDMSSVPVNVTLLEGQVELTGLSTRSLNGVPGTWKVQLLDRRVDTNWRRLSYTEIHTAPVEMTLGTLDNADLAASKVNTIVLNQVAVDLLAARKATTGRASIRLDFKPFGPSVESANIMDWDAAAPSVLRLLHIRP